MTNVDTPAVDESIIAALDAATTEALANEQLAIAAIRERYAQFARHNGYIMTASYESYPANSSIERYSYYRINGKRVRALKCFDAFSKNREDQNNGTLDGYRLYLTETGEWIELKRFGKWSAWQGSPEQYFRSW